MTIENYSTDYERTEILDKYCREENKSDAFKAGALDGIDGTLRRRKNTPASDFQAEIVGSKIRISGRKTYDYKDRLKTFEGRWNRQERCWELPEDKMQAIKSDEILGPALSGGYSKEYSKWISDYNDGKEWFHQHGSDILKSSPRR